MKLDREDSSLHTIARVEMQCALGEKHVIKITRSKRTGAFTVMHGTWEIYHYYKHQFDKAKAKFAYIVSEFMEPEYTFIHCGFQHYLKEEK